MQQPDTMDSFYQSLMTASEEEARFEEGEKVDVKKYLTDAGNPDAGEAWEDNTEEYKDKFKAGKQAEHHARFEEGKSVDVEEYLETHGNPEAAKKWREMKEEYGDKFKSKQAASEVNKIILEQFGGRRALFMIGGQAFSIDENTLGIQFKNRTRSRGNYVEIKYIPGRDTYTMTFYNVSIRAKKEVKKYTDIYGDMLGPVFERQVGMVLRLASDKTRLLKAALKVAAKHPEYREALVKMAAKWETKPKGWTDKSRKEFWDSLTSAAPKHKVTECMKKMEGKVGDPGAFCGSLADRVLGKKWRTEAAEERNKKAQDEYLSIDEVRELCPPCAEKMASRRIRRVKASVLRAALTKAAAR